jgi:hypothetical protein
MPYVNYVKHSDQKEDGSFDHFVVFGGDYSPWVAPDNLCVKFATEADADKMIALLQDYTDALDALLRAPLFGYDVDIYK